MNMRKENQEVSFGGIWRGHERNQNMYRMVTAPGWESGPEYMAVLECLNANMTEALFASFGSLARDHGFSAEGGPKLCTLGRVMLACDNWRSFEVALAGTLAYGKTQGWAA